MTMTVAMTKPVVTHVICSTVTPSEPVRCGTATLTIEASMAPISVPKVIDTVTSHLLTGLRSPVVVAPPAAMDMVPAVISGSPLILSAGGSEGRERRIFGHTGSPWPAHAQD